MNQQPDELFRRNLEGFQKPAPASAWEKIAAAQNKKTNKGLWLKIAASLLLLALAIYTRWPNTPANENVSGLMNETPAVQQPVAPTSPQHNDEIQERELPKSLAERSGKTTYAAGIESRQTKTVVTPDITESVTISMEELDTESASEYPDSTLLESTYLQTSENITLVFTEKEVNEYLEKKEIAEATDDTKKPSTWKKLLKKANNLTNNQDPFGELRQKKNEILALNFRNEKQRSQNKQ